MSRLFQSKSILYFCFAPSTFCSLDRHGIKSSDRNVWTLFACKPFYGKKNILYCTYLVWPLNYFFQHVEPSFQHKSVRKKGGRWLLLKNKEKPVCVSWIDNSFKHVQRFATHNSN